MPSSSYFMKWARAAHAQMVLKIVFIRQRIKLCATRVCLTRNTHPHHISIWCCVCLCRSYRLTSNSLWNVSSAATNRRWRQLLLVLHLIGLRLQRMKCGLCIFVCLLCCPRIRLPMSIVRASGFNFGFSAFLLFSHSTFLMRNAFTNMEHRFRSQIEYVHMNGCAICGVAVI